MLHLRKGIYWLPVTFISVVIGIGCEQQEVDTFADVDSHGLVSMGVANWSNSGSASSSSSQGTNGPEPSEVTEDPCPSWRWIGITAGEECPKPTGYTSYGWKTSRLFGNLGQSDDADPFHTFTSRLSKYCLYENKTTSVDTSALIRLRWTQELTALSRDCVVNTAQSPWSSLWKKVYALPTYTLAELAWRDMRDNFYEQTGRSPTMPRYAALNRTIPRLAVVDTAPTQRPDLAQTAARTPGSAKHGFAITNMAADFVCEELDDVENTTDTGPVEPCIAHISTRLALSYKNYRSDKNVGNELRDDALGGYVGTIGDLADAIMQEVKDWEINNGGDINEKEPHLVLNLSVGFLKTWLEGGSSFTTWPTSVRALYEALQYASCSGVLAIAAAGNRTYGANREIGALYPAAWETHPAPSFDECVDILERQPNPLDFPSDNAHSKKTPYRPLIYSAGGVVNNGNRIGNGASRGFPRIGAFSDHAVVLGRYQRKPTAILTGTSIAAIVTSSAAAAWWYYLPQLRSWEVMQRVYASARELNFQADYCLGDDACPVSRRVSVCKTMFDAHSLGQVRWTFPAPSASSREGIDANQAVEAIRECSEFVGSDVATADNILESSFADNANNRSWNYGVDWSPLQIVQTDVMSEPWVFPQPSVIGCPACHIRLDQQSMYIRTVRDPDILTEPRQATLTLNRNVAVDGGATQPLSYRIELPSETDSRGLVVTELPIAEWGLQAGDSAILAIPLDGDLITTTSLAIVE